MPSLEFTMHPRNRHQLRYDLKKLAEETPELKKYIQINQYEIETLDFSVPEAVKILNKALLKSQYGIQFWELPPGFLCPPIPGRADYIHSAADLFEHHQNLRVLDIGVGANCIYPLLGVKEYHWTFVGSDVNQNALENAQRIVDRNHLTQEIVLRMQKDKSKIFTHIIGPNEFFDLTICNPPFHESQKAAESGSMRKWKNLGKKPAHKLNFGGQENELWFPGGEEAFLLNMIHESLIYKNQVKWFTTLVSKEKNLLRLVEEVRIVGGKTKTIDMGQGQKKSRLLAWKFPNCPP